MRQSLMVSEARFGDPRLPDRFWNKVMPEPNTGCWLWTGGCAREYGKFFVGLTMQITHRVAYTALVGPVPAGLDIDHLCRTRACCNPLHLEPVTRRENLLRGDTVTARNRAITHCPSGHEYSATNTRMTKRGTRECRACDTARYHHEKAHCHG